MTTWYVRPSGGGYGAEDGTSYDDAWPGRDAVVWGAGGVVAGDTLYVAGTIDDGAWNIDPVGASDGHITIRGNYPGDPGIIDGNGEGFVLQLQGDTAEYIDFIGLKIRNAGGASGRCIYIRSATITNTAREANITFTGCEIYNSTKQAAQLYGSKITFTDCRFHQIDEDAIGGSGNDWSFVDCQIYDFGNEEEGDGIQLGNLAGQNANNDRLLVRGCAITYDRTSSPHKQCVIVQDGAAASFGSVIEKNTFTGGQVVLRVSQTGAIIRWNRIVCDSIAAAGIQASAANNQKVYGNIVTGEATNALIYLGVDVADGCEVTANVVVGDGSSVGILGSGAQVTNSAYRNNIVIDCGTGIKLNAASYTESNNCYFNNTLDLVDDLDSPLTKTGARNVDPRLDALYRATNDALIAAGVAVAGVTQDYDGVAYHPQPTIGAHEMFRRLMGVAVVGRGGPRVIRRG